MDLLVLVDAPTRHRELSLKACIASHRSLYEGGRLAIVHHNGTPLGVTTAMLKELHSCAEEVCVTSDTNIIVDGIDPWIPRAFRYSMYAKRKGLVADAMVNTIGELLDKGMTTYDFEPRAPKAMKTADLIETLQMMGGRAMLWSTLHNNRMCHEPVRVEDPQMAYWKYNHRPSAPSISLSDTCYENHDCIKWLRQIAST